MSISRRPKPRSYWGDVRSRFLGSRVAVLGALLIVVVSFAALIGPLVLTADPYQVRIKDRLIGPSAAHLAGTDEMGRDVLARALLGARVSLAVSLASVAFSLTLGTVLGLLAGYYGRATDEIIMRLMDILFAFPAVLLAIAIIAILSPGTQNTALAIGIVYTPIFARIARGSVIQVRNLDYVTAARALGTQPARIMFRHVLPNALAPIIVETSLSLGFAILTEASLSFLGLGTQPPMPSLGGMLSEGRAFIQQAPWVAVFPGLLIMVAVLGFNLLGDGIRDALDPRFRGRGSL